MIKHIATTLIAVLLCSVAYIVAGCANKTTKETVTIETSHGKVTYRAEDAVWSLLSLTGEKDSEYVSAMSSKVTGVFATESDPNSINEAGGILGDAVKAIIVK